MKVCCNVVCCEYFNNMQKYKTTIPIHMFRIQ